MDTPFAPNPPPPDDPAARFRAPNAPPEDAGAEPPKPAPRPQTLGRLLEETLVAPFRLGALFDELAQEPVPGYGLMIANLAIYWVAMLGLNLLHVAIVRPQALRYPPELFGLVAAGALLFIVLAGFALAGVLELAALASGAASDYGRSFQLLTLLSLIGPLQAAANWIPSAWPVPLILGAVACAIGLERLHKASAAGARVVIAVLAAAGLSSIWAARRVVERALIPLEAAQESAAQLQTLAAQLQQAQLPAQAAATAPPGAQQVSSLDMLRAGGIAGPGAGGLPAQAEQMEKAAAGMMGSLAPALNDPSVMSKIPPQQADALKQISAVLAQTQASLQTGKPVDPRAQQAQLQQMLSALGQLQKSLPQQPSGGTPAQQQQYLQMQKMLKQITSQAPGQGQFPQAAPQPGQAQP